MNRKSKIRACAFVGVLSGLSAPHVTATEDVIVLWKQATFRSKSSDIGAVEINAETAVHEGTFRLSKLTFRINAKAVPCPTALYIDLDFPQLETFHIVEQYRAPLQIRFKWGEHPTYLGEGVSDYPEVRIDVEKKGCTRREFTVPKAGGVTTTQKEKP